MTSDLDVLRELINEQALVPLEETHYGKKTVILGEFGNRDESQYSIKIKGVPNDAVVVKTDMFPSPSNIFTCLRGECKRADYVIIANSETRGFIVYIEMKGGSGNATEIVNQLKGSECFISYCRSIVHKFWKRSNFLDPYESRFVAFRRIRIRKSRTRERHSTELHDDPERVFTISDVGNGGDVYFGKLIQGGSRH